MLKCPKCEKQFFGRPTECDGCGYRFTRADYDKVEPITPIGKSEYPVTYDDEKSKYAFLPIINGILVALNMLLLFLPIASGFGMDVNLFSFMKESSAVASFIGGSYASAAISFVYALMVVMFILELIFMIMSFMGKRASGGMGLFASLYTLWFINGVTASISSDYLTFCTHMVRIIPIVTFILSIVVLAVVRNKK